MCRKYPGRRCGNPVHERVEALRLQVEEAKAFRDALDPDVVRRGNINEASRRVVLLENRLKDAQRKYDSTDAGYAALEAEAQDQSLSRAERTALKVRLKEAEKDRAERAKVLSDAEARRANVMAYLEECGVPASERIDFNDTNIYLPAAGSAKHYETIKNNRYKAYEARLADYNKGLAKAQSAAQKAAVEAKEGLAVEKAKADFNRALHVYDATSAGVEALKAKVAKAAANCYTDKQVDALTKLELRLFKAQKAHRLNLDSRNYRTAKLAQLRAVVEAHGGDVDGAVKAFKNKTAPAKTATRRVPVEDMRERKVFAHLTERDTALIEAAFRQSPEFEAGGEAARARFLERKIMTPPHELYAHETLDEADAKVVIGSNGKTGRNNTIIDGNGGIARNRKLCIHVTDHMRETIESQAQLVGSTKSSLLRDKLLGQNPLARQNDRSAEVRAEKRMKASKILREGIVAA